MTTIDISEKHGATNKATPVYTTRSARLKALFTPAVPITGPAPTFVQSLMATLKYTPLNICLLFIPVSWALHYTHQSAMLIFVFSALGIIPLAALLGFGTEQIAVRTSSSVGGLLNATLGNIVEMIIAGIALKEVGPP
jgi:Ca2+:H+ antiporter